MNKILISWMGFNQDFIVNKKDTSIFQADPNGLTSSIHQNVYEKENFNKHIILVSNLHDVEEKKRIHFLKDLIQKNHPNHNLEFREIPLQKAELNNYQKIESLQRSFLMSFGAEYDLHVVAGMGTTSMNMAWALLRSTSTKPFHLYVLNRKIHVGEEERSLLVPVNPSRSPVLDNVLIEKHLKVNIPAENYRDAITDREYSKAAQIALASDVNVLLLGETGSGKDLMAEFIRNNSPLKDAPYRAINCASLTDELLSSELFGHEKGAFTGALYKKIGLFEACNGGTLFMDEIGDISDFMQQSLLRVLENKEIKRMGSNEVLKDINVRVIAATHNNLLEKCASGAFRWDLYYRLCDVEIELEPFHKRTGAARKKVIQHFMTLAEKKWGRTMQFSKTAEKIMFECPFPGNFREVRNSINGLFALNKKQIEMTDLPKRFLLYGNVEKSRKLDDVIKNHVKEVYLENNRNMAATSRILGYSNQHLLKKKMEKWGLL